MNMNVIGGLVAVAALAAIFVLHGHHRAAPAPMPTPIASVPLPTPRPAVAGKPIENSCTVDHPCHTVEVTGTAKKPVYRKVLKGGKLGGPVTCDHVPQVAFQFPPDQVIAAAKQYGMTPGQLAELRVCLKN